MQREYRTHLPGNVALTPGASVKTDRFRDPSASDFASHAKLTLSALLNYLSIIFFIFLRQFKNTEYHDCSYKLVTFYRRIERSNPLLGLCFGQPRDSLCSNDLFPFFNTLQYNNVLPTIGGRCLCAVSFHSRIERLNCHVACTVCDKTSDR